MQPDSKFSRVDLRQACILIVDDQEVQLQLIARILDLAGFKRVHTTTSSLRALEIFEEVAPDLVMLDVQMPELDGFALLERLRPLIDPSVYLPVLAITGDTSSETRKGIIVAGAKDFLAKPFDSAEVIVRVENLLTTRALHQSLLKQNEVLEDKVRERTVELELAIAAVTAASKAKSQFLATMSHELRTPLNAVIGFARHLEKNKAGNLFANDISLVKRIGANGKHLLEIIDEILDLSRVEAGKMVVESQRVDLKRIVSETLAQISTDSTWRIPQVTSLVSVPEGLQPLETDEPKLRRVLINLVANAAKFTQRGYFRVGVCADAEGKPLRIDVVDTGIGIPRDRLSAIFDMFEQADNSTQRRFGGTGLGLAISRTLCELLGYRISVTSEPDVGSAFSVLLLPTAQAPASYRDLAAFYQETPVLAG